MTRLAGVIGHPVAHSLSPAFQSAAFRASGLDVRYELWDTSPESLAGRLVSLRDPKYLGANVTIPHKESVIPLLDELGGQSSRVGAVNTLVNRSGRLFGFNTDGQGFVLAMRNEACLDPAGRSVLLLGAGGAARGIVFALLEAKAAGIAIWNRTFERAERLAADAAAAAPGTTVAAIASLADLSPYDVIVNCTSIGMDGTGTESQSPCDISTARPGTLIADIVYAPAETPLLRAAREAGLPVLPGLPMLIYQGALSFELWTGVPAPVEVMFEAAQEALAERHARGAGR